MKKLIEIFRAAVVVVAVLMLLPSPGYSFRAGGGYGYHAGHWTGGRWGTAARPYYRGARGYPYYGYSRHAGYPLYARACRVVYRRTIVEMRQQPPPAQPAPAPKQDRN